MPIIFIWNVLAIPSIPTFNRMLSGIRTAGELIEKWLRRQLETAEKLDRKTAGFPIFRFYNMALVAQVAAHQRGAITPAVDTTMGAQMERVGRAWKESRFPEKQEPHKIKKEMTVQFSLLLLR